MSADYLNLVVTSHSGESEPAFKSRLSHFWTHMLRGHPAEFGKVYAETVAFTPHGEALARQYLVEAEVINLLERELAAADIAHEPIDRDDVYSKYEATPPEWMWIEH